MEIKMEIKRKIILFLLLLLLLLVTIPSCVNNGDVIKFENGYSLVDINAGYHQLKDYYLYNEFNNEIASHFDKYSTYGKVVTLDQKVLITNNTVNPFGELFGIYGSNLIVAKFRKGHVVAGWATESICFVDSTGKKVPTGYDAFDKFNFTNSGHTTDSEKYNKTHYLALIDSMWYFCEVESKDTLFRVRDYKPGSTNLIDGDNGIFVAQNMEDKYAYFTIDDGQQTEYAYDTAHDFADGMALVVPDARTGYGYIDTSFQEVIKPGVFDHIHRRNLKNGWQEADILPLDEFNFSSGYAKFMVYNGTVKNWGYINKSGKVEVEAVYEVLPKFVHPGVKAKQDGKSISLIK